ncbi:MAG: phosphoadenylyl-sulfate reductase [Acidobacteria bacterium]|nr:phosphoadenylyl-sulfate reductase [Acidobacteriota bacterium]
MSNVAVLQGWADRTAPLEACADALEGAPPEEILRWAIDRYADRLTFATGFGAEGCVLIDLIGRHRLPIDLFTLDTGVLFPETRELWRRLEARYRLTIRGVRPQPAPGDDAGVSLDPAHRLWERDPDGCCARRKVLPLAAELGRVDAWITAIRRDQTPQRANAPIVGWDAKFGIAKVNPLVAWTSRDVWRYLRTNDVPYNPLHDRGYPSVGCRPCTSPVRPGEDARAGRWRGTAKTECGLHGSSVLEEAPAT